MTYNYILHIVLGSEVEEDLDNLRCHFLTFYNEIVPLSSSSHAVDSCVGSKGKDGIVRYYIGSVHPSSAMQIFSNVSDEVSRYPSLFFLPSPQ